MPSEAIVLPPVDISYSASEYESIQAGHIPEDMDDKWFMYADGDVLHCHRSWTGLSVYQVMFTPKAERYSINRILFNSEDINESRKVNLPHQRDMALFLIDRILLGRNVAFPVDPDVKISSAKDYWMLRHGAVGNSVSTKDQQNEQT